MSRDTDLIVTQTSSTGSHDNARLPQPQDSAIQHRYITKNRQQHLHPRHNKKMPKKKMPKSTRAFLQPDSSSHREMSRDVAKRRKTSRSAETIMTPASQRTNETTNDDPERSPPNFGSGIARYHLRSGASRKGSSVVDAKQQPVWQEHSSREGEKSDEEEGIFDIKGDQLNISTSPLCHHCRYIFDNWSKWTDNKYFCYPHYENRFQLIDSAKNGCSLCYQFCRNRFEGQPGRGRNREGGVAGVRLEEDFIHKMEAKESRRIALTLSFKMFSGSGNLIVDQFDEFEVDMIPAVPRGEEI
jgi:hypothetical protein